MEPSTAAAQRGVELIRGMGVKTARMDKGRAMRKSCYLSLLFAWVLWTHVERPSVDEWNATPGFENREKCLASLKEQVAVWDKGAKVTGTKTTLKDKTGAVTFLCLADTDDPRSDPRTKRKQ